MKRWMAVLAAAVLVAAAAYWGTAVKKSDIVIASANPMSGSSAQFGEMKVKAMQLAVDECNANGGIDGRRIRLRVEDDASDAKAAHAVAERLAASADVVAVVGHWNSAATLAARHVYNGAGLPVITDSVNQAITDGTTPYLFRISITDARQAQQLADYMFNKLQQRKVGVVYAHNDFGRGLREEFLRRWENLGGEVGASAAYFEGQTADLTRELQVMKDAGCQAIFVAGYYQEMALVARQTNALGWNVPLIGTEGTSSEELIRLGRDAVEGVRFAGFFHPDRSLERAQDFVAAFRSRYGQEPDSYAALAYDSLRLILEAAAKEGASRQQIFHYLSNVNGFEGVTGTIGFDAHHDAQSKIIILTIRGGRIVPDAQQL